MYVCMYACLFVCMYVYIAFFYIVHLYAAKDSHESLARSAWKGHFEGVTPSAGSRPPRFELAQQWLFAAQPGSSHKMGVLTIERMGNPMGLRS